MSEWYTPEEGDIEIDNGEVNILVTYNDSGNIYAVLTYEQIRNILSEINNK